MRVRKEISMRRYDIILNYILSQRVENDLVLNKNNNDI